MKLPYQGKSDVMACIELNHKESSIGPLHTEGVQKLPCMPCRDVVEMFRKVTDLRKAEDSRLTPKSGDEWESRVGCRAAASARSRLGC